MFTPEIYKKKLGDNTYNVVVCVGLFTFTIYKQILSGLLINFNYD